MAAGLLQVDGTISLGQFWPKGRADADTTTIHVEVGASAFRFREHSGASFRATHVLDNAEVRGQGTRPCVNKGKLTVRLQGVDAPELHYRPTAHKPKKDQTPEQHELYLKWNLEFRQRLGETATVELAKLLASSGVDPLPCTVESAVEVPSDVFDTYGRLVGDILVQVGGKQVRVNDWLLEQGWALPAFYSSMSEEEITRQTDLANEAWANDRGVWPFVSDFVRPADFDWKMVYEKGSLDPAVDAQPPVVVPKLFRRLSAYSVNKKAKMVTGNFHAYLVGKADQCHLAEEFLVQGPAASHTYSLAEFVETDGQVTRWPEEIIFREKPSKVVGPGGKEVTAF